MSEELKPKSFRVSDETANKFKEISAAIGGNQQETLARLIDIYEMQASKAAMPSAVANRLEDLNGHLTAITRIYMDMVDGISTCRQTAHAEYAAQLQAKDTIIADLQGQIAECTKQLAALEQARNTAVAEVKTQLADAQGEVIKLQKQVVDLQGQLLDRQNKTTKQSKAKAVE